jgi:hypothetical protein
MPHTYMHVSLLVGVDAELHGYVYLLAQHFSLTMCTSISGVLENIRTQDFKYVQGNLDHHRVAKYVALALVHLNVGLLADPLPNKRLDQEFG